MSLRKRLTIRVLLLFGAGLILAEALVIGTIRAHVVAADERRLSAVGGALEPLLTGRSSDRLEQIMVTGDDRAAVWRAMATTRDIPGFFQLRDTSGHVLSTAGVVEGPVLPDVLPQRLRPLSGGDGERFSKIGDERTDWRRGIWRLRSSRLPDGRILLVGMRSSEFDELLGPVPEAILAVTLAVLAGTALLIARTVRRETVPLERMAKAAERIRSDDLTSRVEATGDRSEVDRLGLAFNAMLARIETAFAERTASEERLRRFVADASHELRTPVATVRGYAELFRLGAEHRPDDLAKSMARIESEATRMGKLVDEMLLLARLDQGHRFESEIVDLTELAADAVSDALVLEPARSISIDSPGPVLILGDSDRLRQVLANLFANIRHHTPPEAPASLKVETTAALATLELADHGPGLAPDFLDRAFERFSRGDGSRTRGSGGAGLGLSIVEAIITAHGGITTIHPTDPTGTTIKIALPVRQH